MVSMEELLRKHQSMYFPMNVIPLPIRIPYDTYSLWVVKAGLGEINLGKNKDGTFSLGIHTADQVSDVTTLGIQGAIWWCTQKVNL